MRGRASLGSILQYGMQQIRYFYLMETIRIVSENEIVFTCLVRRFGHKWSYAATKF